MDLCEALIVGITALSGAVVMLWRSYLAVQALLTAARESHVQDLREAADMQRKMRQEAMRHAKTAKRP